MRQFPNRFGGKMDRGGEIGGESFESRDKFQPMRLFVRRIFDVKGELVHFELMMNQSDNSGEQALQLLSWYGDHIRHLNNDIGWKFHEMDRTGGDTPRAKSMGVSRVDYVPLSRELIRKLILEDSREKDYSSSGKQEALEDLLQLLRRPHGRMIPYDQAEWLEGAAQEYLRIHGEDGPELSIERMPPPSHVVIWDRELGSGISTAWEFHRSVEAAQAFVRAIKKQEQTVQKSVRLIELPEGWDGTVDDADDRGKWID